MNKRKTVFGFMFGDFVIKLVYSLLTMLFLYLCFESFFIFTSLIREVPWYEPCGMQFLGVIFVACPGMIMVGVGYLILAKFADIGKYTMIMPFLTMLILGVTANGSGRFDAWLNTLGAATCLAAIIISVILGSRDSRAMNKSDK